VKDYRRAAASRSRQALRRPGAGGAEDDRRVQGRREALGIHEEYAANSRGFYFLPADPQENNTRIFIVNSSVKQIQFQD